jgi:ankyrin repeat protein
MAHDHRSRTPGIDNILTPILDDDVGAVERLLKSDARLAKDLIHKPRLHTHRILHWIYAGDTALHLAAAGYRVQIVRALLSAGADPNAAQNHRRSTPLHYAADGAVSGPAWNEDRQVETIRQLIDHGSNVHAQDKNGATPLHRAVRTRCAAAVRTLLRAGADPEARNNPGSTPFHLAVQDTGHGGAGAPAARTAQKQIIQEFLSLGLSPSLKSTAGKTVAECARSAWIQELLASL